MKQLEKTVQKYMNTKQQSNVFKYAKNDKKPKYFEIKIN